MDIAVASNDGLSAKCYQLFGSLRKTTDVLKIELENKQATKTNLLTLLKVSQQTKIKSKKDESREQQALKVCRRVTTMMTL